MNNTTTFTNLNIFQAATKLRTDYAHLDGLITDCVENQYTNLYFIFHDALHTLLGQPPHQEYENIVLAAEMLLGGIDINIDIDIDYLTTLIANLPDTTIEILISFYTDWFNN